MRLGTGLRRVARRLRARVGSGATATTDSRRLDQAIDLGFDEEAFERRITWIFGSPRSGSTWLLQLLGEHERVLPINEPLIGVHLAPFAPNLIGLRATHFSSRQVLFNTLRADSPNYFFSRAYEHAWRPLTRRLLLGRLHAEASQSGRKEHDGVMLLIKEPNGSQAADLILSLLPRSRLLFLLRDGRDIVDSELDALRRGSWLEAFGDFEVAAGDRLPLIEHLSRTWVFRTDVVQRAYEAHPPADRLLLRYEDLLRNTAGSVSSIYRWLGLETSEKAVLDAVSDRSFAAIPAAQKGSGKFTRAASPGMWRQNLSADEQRVMHEAMAEKLDELGYR